MTAESIRPIIERPGGAASGGDLLVVDELSTTFVSGRRRVRAVDRASLALAEGQTLGIVGESGSGKSVLVRSIMGLDPRGSVTRREGGVWFKGRDLSGLTRRQLREIWGNEIAIVMQDPMTALNPVVPVGRQLREGMQRHLGLSRSEASARAIDLLERVGIPNPEHRARQYPHEMSGGMRQRICIAMALSCEPDLLIADEPTTALDVTVQAQILALLLERRRERNMAMLFVTHDLAVIARVAHAVAVMYAGQIVEQAPVDELFRNMRMPYTRALMDSIPQLNYPSQTRLSAIPGRPPSASDAFTGCRFAPRCTHVRPDCRDRPPELTRTGTGHLFRCWYPVDDRTARDVVRARPEGRDD